MYSNDLIKLQRALEKYVSRSSRKRACCISGVRLKLKSVQKLRDKMKVHHQRREIVILIYARFAVTFNLINPFSLKSFDENEQRHSRTRLKSFLILKNFSFSTAILPKRDELL